MVFLKLPQWFDSVLRVLIYFWYLKGGNLFETRFLHVLLSYFWYLKGGNLFETRCLHVLLSNFWYVSLFETRFLHVLLSWEATNQMFIIKLQHGTFKAGSGCLFKRGCLSEGGRYIELLQGQKLICTAANNCSSFRLSII